MKTLEFSPAEREEIRKEIARVVGDRRASKRPKDGKFYRPAAEELGAFAVLEERFHSDEKLREAIARSEQAKTGNTPDSDTINQILSQILLKIEPQRTLLTMLMDRVGNLLDPPSMPERATAPGSGKIQEWFMDLHEAKEWGPGTADEWEDVFLKLHGLLMRRYADTMDIGRGASVESSEGMKVLALYPDMLRKDAPEAVQARANRMLDEIANPKQAYGNEHPDDLVAAVMCSTANGVNEAMRGIRNVLFRKFFSRIIRADEAKMMEFSAHITAIHDGINACAQLVTKEKRKSFQSQLDYVNASLGALRDIRLADGAYLIPLQAIPLLNDWDKGACRKQVDTLLGEINMTLAMSKKKQPEILRLSGDVLTHWQQVIPAVHHVCGGVRTGKQVISREGRIMFDKYTAQCNARNEDFLPPELARQSSSGTVRH